MIQPACFETAPIPLCLESPPSPDSVLADRPQPSSPPIATGTPRLAVLAERLECERLIAEITSPATALVAADDAMVVALLTSALESAGYVVEPVQDGVAALASLARRSFDLLVVELDLPRRTGWEVLQGVRRLGGLRPKILVTTVQQGPRLESQLRASGADDLVRRPFVPDELQTRLERLYSSEPREVAVA